MDDGNIENPAEVSVENEIQIDSKNEIQNENKPKFPGKKSPILVGAVVAIVTIIVSISFGLFSSNPKDKVMNAILKTYNEAIMQSEDIIGVKEVYKKISEGSSKQTMNFSVDNINTDYFNEVLKGAGLNLIMAKDTENKKAYFEAMAAYKGMDFNNIGLKSYIDSENVVISIPAAFKNNFKFNPKNVSGQYNDSIWYSLFRTKFDDGIDFDIFAAAPQSSLSEDSDTNSYFGSEDWKKVCENITVEKTDDLESFEVDGKNFESPRYHLSIPKESAQLFIKTYFENKDFSNLESLLEQLAYASYSSGMPSAATYIDYMRGSIIDFVSYPEKYIVSDLSAGVFIDKDGRIVNYDIVLPIQQSDNEIIYNIETTYKGGSRLAENMITLVDVVNGDKTAQLSFTKEGGTDKDTGITSSDSNMSIITDGDTLNMWFNTSYEKENGSFTVQTGGGLNGDNIILEALGKISNVVKGEAFDVAVDNLSLTIENNEIISMSGEYHLSDISEGDITPIEGEALDLFKLSQNDIMALTIEFLSSDLGALLGSL